MCGVTGRIMAITSSPVIARSGSDEAIQTASEAALDCFAEFILSAAAGGVEGLAMTVLRAIQCLDMPAPAP